MNFIEDIREIRGLRKNIKELEKERDAIQIVQQLMHEIELEEQEYRVLVDDTPSPDLVYKPLKIVNGGPTIRLLEILTSQPMWAPLKCKLHHIPLANVPVFDAISYCWGDPKQRRAPLYCDGAELSITRTSANVIMRLRRQDESRFVWIDAVCINQSDDLEKNQQVVLMRDIYRSSSRVFVWLGEDEGGGGEGIACNYMFRQANEALALADDRRNIAQFSFEERKNFGIPPLDHREIQAFLSLFDRPWFHRVWTIQEVAVAPLVQVLCGKEDWTVNMVTWDHLMEAFDIARRMEYFNAAFKPWITADLMKSARVTYQGSRHTRLLPLLSTHRNSEATNPKDKVYALLGLLKGPSPIPVTYEETVTVEKVYLDTAIAIINQEHNLNLLEAPREDLESKTRDGPGYVAPASSITKLKDLPTWVPDWSITVRASSLQSIESIDRIERFHTTCDSSYELLLNGTKLGVSGYPVAQIQSLSKVLTIVVSETALSLNDMQIRVQGLINQWNGLKMAAGFSPKTSKDVYMPTGESLQDAFWQTIIAGLDQDDDFNSMRDNYLEFEAGMHKTETFKVHKALPLLKYFKSKAVTDKIGQGFKKVGLGGPGPGFDAFRIRMDKVMGGRRVMRSDNELLGLVPQMAKVEDQIMLIKGARVPIVLRRKGVDWEFIGESYVHGMMEGSMWDERKAEKMWLV